MTLSLIFQFIAKDKIYKKNNRINGVNNTSVLCKIGKPEKKQTVFKYIKHNYLCELSLYLILQWLLKYIF